MSSWWTGYMMGMAMSSSSRGSCKPKDGPCKLKQECRCPKCGGTSLLASVQIESGHDVILDENAIWECKNPECGYKANQEEFFVEQSPENNVDEEDSKDEKVVPEEKVEKHVGNDPGYEPNVPFGILMGVLAVAAIYIMALLADSTYAFLFD